MHGGGWTIAPVWLKDLHQLRPCLLYICIAQFHDAAENYQWPGGSYLGLPIIRFSSGSPLVPSSQQERQGAYRQSFSVIDRDILWSISGTRPYMVRENTSSVCAFQACIYTGTQNLRAKHFIWRNERTVHLEVRPFSHKIHIAKQL